MSRYTGPKFKLSRRLGISLSGTGKELQNVHFPPGQHGPNQRRKISGYGMQLQEKQKLRHMYGLNEKQFRNLFDKAAKMKGIAGENFMVLLESRLDNLVYRLGLVQLPCRCASIGISRSRYCKRQKSGHRFLHRIAWRCNRLARAQPRPENN